MGEIAEQMINGETCEMCGVFLDYEDEPMGIPMYCSESCAIDRGVPKEEVRYRVLPSY